MKQLLLLALVIITAGASNAQSPQMRRQSINLKHGAHRLGMRTDSDMQRWREYGLGQFIHWGVYAIAGGHWNGKYYGGAAEWIRSWQDMPKEDYDNLYKTFNPKGFDATVWARQAKDMGAKYMIITTKHHDGFCLWNSKFTDYTIANTPYKKDIVKELVDAYTKEGIDVYLYFSIIDWRHKGYRTTLKPEDREAYEEFKQFTRNQLRELLTMFPQAKGLWFDGTWDKAWVEQAAFADSLDSELRNMKQGLVIGSRFRADEYGKRHYDSNGDLMGDYEQQYERNLPDTYEEVRGKDWDCVMTIPENQWGYHSDWRGYVKSSYDLLEMLLACVSMNGNLVINFGPDGNGIIRPEETARAKEIGAWLKVNGEAVYGCSRADLKKQDWGYFTQRGNKLYLSVFNMPVSGYLLVELPSGSSIQIQKAYMLQDNQQLAIVNAGKNKKNNRLLHIALPQGYTAVKPFVVAVDIDNSKDNGADYQQAKM